MTNCDSKSIKKIGNPYTAGFRQVISRLTLKIYLYFRVFLLLYLGIYHRQVQITIENSKDPLLAVFDNIPVDQQEAIKGYIISKDPITLTAFPNVRSVSADTTVYHNEGTNAVQELAYALALAAKFAEQEESFEAFSKKFFVSFAIDTQFF